MQEESSEYGESASLVEHVQVAEGELLGDWLLDLDGCGVFLLFTVVVGSELDVANSCGSIDGQLDLISLRDDSKRV